MTQYYALFDDPNQRVSLVNMYNVSVEFCELIVLLANGLEDSDDCSTAVDVVILL